MLNVIKFKKNTYTHTHTHTHTNTHTHTYTHTHTHIHEQTNKSVISGTPPYKGSTHRRDLCLYNTQHSPETDMDDRGGVRNRNPSKRAAADLLVRPRRCRDPLKYPVSKCTYCVVSVQNMVAHVEGGT